MAWKTFENGYPLYASELNNYLMKQSVVVFASAAERDSILTAPTEGQVVWLQDSNAFKIYNGTAWTDINDNTDAIQKSLLTTAGDTIYATGSATPARLALGSTGSLLKSNGSAPTWLGVGTSGQVLSSTGSDLAWTTPSSGGGMTLLSTTTLSGSSTTINSITGGYKDLRIVFTDIKTNAYAYIYVKPNNANVKHVANNGSQTWNKAASGSAINSLALAASTSAYEMVGPSWNTNYVYNIYDYTSTTEKSLNYIGGSTATGDVNYGFGVTSSTSAITSLVITTPETFTQGTIKIYGVS